MRILRIADVPNNRTGGMSRLMHATGDAMVTQGHQVSYLFSEDLPRVRRSILRRIIVPLRIPRLVRRLIERGGFDVIEIHEPLAAASCLLRRTLKTLPPIAILSHGLEERSLPEEIAYRRKKGLIVPPRARAAALITIVQARYAVRHADQMLCSNSQDVVHLERAGVSRSRLNRHFNGVETEFLEAGRAKSDSREVAARGLLFVGSWLERKGILDLVPALHTVLREHPDMNFTAAGCGVKSEDVLQAFEPDVRSQVQAIPKIEHTHELLEVYGRHNIFVLPSFFEGHPLVMVEAAAMGLALVTTNVCGMLDFVEHERNGLLVPVANPHALACSMSRLCRDSVLTHSLGAEAYRTAQKHTWANSAANLTRAYEKACALNP